MTFLTIALYFAAQTRTDASFDSYFDHNDPVYESYITYQADFGSDEVACLLYEVPDKPHGPFDLEVMRKIAHLTEAFENEVPFVREVTSLANVEFIEADGDFVEIHELALDFPETQEALLVRRDLMMKKPIYIDSLVNREGTHGAIIIEMTRTSSDPIEKLRLDPDGGDGPSNLYPQASSIKINEILARPEYADITFYHSGDVQLNAAKEETIDSELGMLFLLTFAIVAFLSMVFSRMRFLGLVGPLMVVLLGLVFTLGFMGVMGYNIDILFLMVPTLLTAIGVAQSIHLISEFQICQSKGLSRREVIRQTFTHVGVPCLLAALTTAAGFWAMSISKIKGISELSVYLGVGVLFCFLLSITVVIFMLSFGRSKQSSGGNKSNQAGEGFLSGILKWIIACNLKHSRLILMISAAIFIVSFIGTGSLKVGFNILEDFKEKAEFRRDTLYIEEVMGGILNVVYVFDTRKPDGIKDFNVLKQLEGLQLEADRNPLVKKTYSIVDVLKDINQSFHGGDPAYYKLPKDNALISQYLLMYEMAGGKELEDYVSGDYARTTLELRVEMTDSSEIQELLLNLQDYMNKNPITAAHVQPTGIGLLWIVLCEYIVDSMISGYVLAFCIIACLMCLAFGSIKVGLLSMIPNLAPVILTLGVMGWAGIHLDYFRLLLATVAIGIAVDDTVHLLTRIRTEFHRCGDYAQAMQNCLSSVGRALIMTSVILAMAFGVYLISDMAALSSFGVLLAVTICTALIADLFLMPVLILVFKPFGKEFHAREIVTDTMPEWSEA